MTGAVAARPSPIAEPAAPPAAPLVIVAVLTYRRPDDLAALLPVLLPQVAAVGGEITVVDNDPDASAAEVCAGRPRVRHVHEPRPGIAAARTRALAEAAEPRARDLLVFIDDDERPGPGWLAALLATYAATPGCVGVVGPVVSTFATPLDPWIAAGGFFDRRRHPTGTAVPVAATNNLLLDLAAVRAAGLTFDERFGLSGGSDTLFTRQLVTSGGRLVWCDEAVVTDVVPADRATRDWVLRRRVRIGNSRSRTELALVEPGPARLATRAGLLGEGLVRVAGGAARLAAGHVRGRPADRARGARTFARGLGITLGALGWTYVEYRRGPQTRSLDRLVRVLGR